MTTRTLALTALAPAAWGTTYAVTTELLPPGRPLLAAALRALPAGLVLVAATRALPTGGWWWRTVVLATLNFTIFFALLFTAAYRLPGGVAATVGAIQPLLVVGLATVALGERPDLRRIVAALTGVAGVALLVLDGGAQLDLLGVIAALVGAASMATGTVLVQRWGRPTSPIGFAGCQLTAGGLMLLPLALLLEGAPGELELKNVGGYLYLGTIGGAIAYSLWFRGIGELGARRATFLSLLSPVVATAVGFALGESLTAWQLGGAVLVLTSIIAAQPTATARRVEATVSTGNAAVQAITP